jgi:RNA ligase (TIGR02306 family)
MADIKRKLATIERISAINPIPEADAIERATIRGWNVVVKKGEHQVGELVVYCEIDSLMPERPEFEFLRSRGFRIRTIKLRGQVSQGIIFPLSIIPDLTIFADGTTMANGEYIVEGTDVTDLLSITKYDPPIPAELSGQVLGNFPSHSIKTDEERIQNLIDHYEDYRKEEWIATEKVDGTSMTAFIFNNIFGISSRNLELKETDSNTFWKVAREIKLEEKMRKIMEAYNLEALTLQGELLGEGIQKNKYKIKGQKVLWFRAFDPMKYQFFPFDTFRGMCEMTGLERVPTVDRPFTLPEKYEDLILYADGESKLYQTAREGVVFVAKNPAYNDNGRLSFKVISNKFILKHEE